MSTAAGYFADEMDEPDQLRARFAITADTADEQVSTIAEQIEASAGTELTGLVEFVQELREGARDVQRAGLQEIAMELRAITQRRDVMIRKIAAWGDEPESLGASAGIGIAQVMDILEG